MDVIFVTMGEGIRCHLSESLMLLSYALANLKFLGQLVTCLSSQKEAVDSTKCKSPSEFDALLECC